MRVKGALLICLLSVMMDVNAQPIKMEWQPVAPGVWKAEIGASQPIDLLRAAGGSPRMEALRALGERRFPLPETECYTEKQDGKIYLRIPLDPEERIFGLGLNFKTVNQRGRVLHLHMDHYGGQDNGRTHAPVPFYVSDKGYGVLVNSAEYITVYAGTGIRTDTKHPPVVYDRNTDKQWEAQPVSDAVEVLVPAAGTEVYVFAGNSALEAVQRYNLFNGGGVLPPKWGLGFTQRVPTLSTADSVRKEVAAFAQHGFPLDFIGLEPGWQTRSYPCTFEWARERFPDPAGFTKEMLDKGIRLNLWLNPYISPSAGIYTDMKSLSGDHTVWNGLVPDPFMHNGMEKLHGLFRQQHLDIGISGYKIDEVDGFDQWLWPDVTKFPSGLSGSEMRQVFATAMQRQTFDWFKIRNQRTYGLVRGANAGGSFLPYVLYDDYYDHRDFITALCNSGFIGVLWTPEVRSSASAEEWLRRFQSVCFSPMAMINAWADGTKPWSYPEVAEQVKQVALLRMQLLPYLYTCFAQYAFEGKPPVRPMELVDGFSFAPDGGGARVNSVTNPYATALQQDIKDQFMVGDYLLVAPMFAGERLRKVVLPAGKWYDFYTGKYAGEKEVIEISPGLDRIPLYVKDGGIIPMIPPVQHAPRTGEALPLEIRVYGNAPGSFGLYDDDGISFDYEKGSYAWYPLNVVKGRSGKWEGQVGTRTGNFSLRQYSGFTWKFMSRLSGDTTYMYVAPLSRGSMTKGDGSIQHPFASLNEAKQAVRELRSKLGGRLPDGGVTMRLRGGVYELQSGFRLDSVDGGTKEAPVIFTAYPGEKVILSGGHRISVGKARTLSRATAQRIVSRMAVSHIREIDLAGLGLGDYGIHQVTGFRRPYVNAAMELFINGQPYRLARYPNDNMVLLDTSEVVDKGRSSGGGTYPGKIRFDKGKLAQWGEAKDLTVAGNFTYAWATDQLRVASANAQTGVVSFADAHPFGITGGKEWDQYYFFNLLEEIDKPGEYFIDRQKGKLYFYPLVPLRSSDTIVVSLLEDALVTMKGASHVYWKDICFDAGRGIGVYMERTVSNRIEHCTIRNMGVVGVCIGRGGKPERQHRLPDPFNPVVPDEGLSERLGSLHELLYENTVFNREGGEDNGVVDCRIEHTGCGGVSLGGGDRITLKPAGNYVYGCTFTDCGRIDYSYRSPVNIDGVGNKVQHCRFDSCPATAIYMHGNDHLIEYNVISEACSFVDDMGAIYIGRDPSEAGNTIRWNFFKNIGRLGMTIAVYFDDGACGSTVYGNVFYKAGTRTVLVGGGKYNRIFNNIFIDSKMAFHLDDRLGNWSKSVLASGGLFELRLRKVNYKGPAYANAYPWLARYFEDHPEMPAHNDIENNVLVRVAQVNNGKKEWGPIHDNNFITPDDPGFVDASRLDFTLKKDAVVFQKLPGFQPIPFSRIGLIR